MICSCWNYSICMIQYIFSLKITTSPDITLFKISAGKHTPSLILVLEHGVFLQMSENSHESSSPTPVGDYHYAGSRSLGLPSSSAGRRVSAAPQTPFQLGGQAGCCRSRDSAPARRADGILQLLKTPYPSRWAGGLLQPPNPPSISVGRQAPAPAPPLPCRTAPAGTPHRSKFAAPQV